MKHLYILLLMVFVAGAVLAQPATIRGTVKTADNQPAQLVSVGLQGTGKGTTSAQNGSYKIGGIAPGSYVVVAAHLGLETRQHSVTLNPGETLTLDFLLEETAQRLQEVVVSSAREKYLTDMASESLRMKTPLMEAPQNIQVVTGAVLKDQQIISMSDGLIRNASGLVRDEHWADLFTKILTRGSQIQAFRNGFNVVNSSWGPLTEDMSIVDHVEFVKGPAGFMLSNGDPSGLYNVVTKKPTGVTKGEASFAVGSFNLYRTTLDLDGRLSKSGRLLYRLNMAGSTRKSHRPNEFNNRYAIAPVLSYQLDDHTKLTLEYNYQRANMSNVGSYYVFSPTGFTTLPIDASLLPAGVEPTNIDDHGIYLHFQHQLADDWNLSAQVGHLIYKQIGSSLWATQINEDGTLLRSIDIWDADSRITTAQVFVNGELETGRVKHRILAGLDIADKKYIADWGSAHELDSAHRPFDPSNPNLGKPDTGYPSFDRSTPLAERAQAVGGLIDQSYSSAYLQDELLLFENKLRLTLAGRYTDIEQSRYGGSPSKAGHFTPRAGLSVSLNNQTSLYALYDQAFIPQNGRLANGNKVQPITGNNMEVGLKRDWAQGKWNTSLSLYRILKNNELTQDPKSPPTAGLSVELGQKVAQGVEFDLRGTLAPGLGLVANYAFTEAKVLKVSEGVTDVKKGDIVPGFARHTANVWLTYELQSTVLKGFGAMAGGSFLGGRATFWHPSPDPAKEAKDYMKVDAGLFWANNRLKITLNVYNLLNEYLYSGSYYSYLNAYSWQSDPPRNARLSIHYSF